MEPLISLTIRNRKAWFAPGDELDCEFQIDRIGPQAILAVEASVLWSTSGKGDVDMGVQYFERRVAEDVPEGDLRELHRFQTILPNGPLSYDGELVKIRWCVRVRVFPIKGKETSFDLPFQLGNLPAPSTVVATVPTKPSAASSADRSSTSERSTLNGSHASPPSYAGEETESVEMTVRRPDEALEETRSDSHDEKQDGESER